MEISPHCGLALVWGLLYVSNASYCLDKDAGFSISFYPYFNHILILNEGYVKENGRILSGIGEWWCHWLY